MEKFTIKEFTKEDEKRYSEQFDKKEEEHRLMIKKGEYIPMYGRCERVSVIIDKKGKKHKIFMRNMNHYDRIGNPVVSKKLHMMESFGSGHSREMDSICNLFDEEAVRKVIGDYISMEYSAGEVVGIGDCQITLFHASSTSQFNFVQIYFDVNNRKIHHQLYEAVNRSVERFEHIIDISDTCGTGCDWMSEVLRGTFERLGYIKQAGNSQIKDGVTVDFNTARIEKIQNGEDGSIITKRRIISDCENHILELFSMAQEESDDEFELAYNCMSELDNLWTGL